MIFFFKKLGWNEYNRTVARKFSYSEVFYSYFLVFFNTFFLYLKSGGSGFFKFS